MAMWRVIGPVIRSVMTHKHNEWDDYEAALPPFAMTATITSVNADNWYLLYKIEVVMPGVQTHSVERRYSEFLQLKQSLKVDLRFFRFPPGKLYLSQRTQVYRQRQLNYFLAYLCSRVLSVNDRILLFQFLNLPTTMLTSGPVKAVAFVPPSDGDKVSDEKTALTEEKKQASEGAQEAKAEKEQSGYCSQLNCSNLLPCAVHPAATAANEQGEEDEVNEAEPEPEGGEAEIAENFEAPAEEEQKKPFFPQFDPNPDKIKLIPDIPYTASQDDNNCLDIYIPAAAGSQPPFPVVVHVHGGGWVRGGRKIGFYGAPSMCKAYAKAGYLSVAVSYRKASAPNHTTDVRAAILWVIENIEKHGGDPKTVFLSGHSAGGNIVSLMVLSPELGLGACPSIKGVIALSGVYNLEGPMNYGWKNRVFKNRYVYQAFGKSATTIIQNSPVCLIHLRLHGKPFESTHCPIARLVGKNKPSTIQGANVPTVPFFILSAADDLGLEKDAVEFTVQLKMLGAHVHYDSVAESNHPNICWADLCHKKVLDWLSALKSKGAAASRTA